MIKSGITVRRVRDILEIPVSTLYYQSTKAEKDQALTEMIQEIAFKHTFYGYRRIHIAVNRQASMLTIKRSIVSINASACKDTDQPRIKNGLSCKCLCL